MQEETNIINREIETLRNNQKEMLEIKKKNVVTEMKNAFERLLVSAACHSKLFKIWLFNTEIYSTTVQEVRYPKLRFKKVGFFVETLRKKLSHASLLGSSGCQKSSVFFSL